MSKFRWMRSKDYGLTLQRWHAFRAMPVGKSFYDWKSVADVFKAKRGDRYVVRVFQPTTSGFDQYQAFTLREAMRLAKFIVGMMYGS